MSQTYVKTFDPARVRPLPDQPRKRFRGIHELADSIAEVGQSTPGLVTLVDGDPDFDAQLVDGERRLRACKLARSMFRAEIQADESADKLYVRSFAANFGREPHDVVEVAEGLARLQRAGKSVTQIKRIAGKSEGWVASHLSLLRLHADVLAMLVPGDAGDAGLTFSLALLLVPIPIDHQLMLARRISSGDMSVSAARRMILQKRRDVGLPYRRGSGGRVSITTIGSILDDAANRVGVYLDMPPRELRSLIGNVDDGTKRTLADKLQALSDNLAGLAEEFQGLAAPPPPKPMPLAAQRFAAER